MTDWKELKKELLKDPEVKKEYDRLAPRYAVVSSLIRARLEKGLTQKELAKKIGTKQSAIARLETGNTNPSLDFLEKVVNAMGYKLQIKIH
ncbi:MAG: helix-turn-helix transcriptional regulator [Patescibacteria group bacterium]